MKSKKLKLDDSIFDDEAVAVDLPKAGKSRSKPPNSTTLLKTIQFQLEDVSKPSTNSNAQFFNKDIRALISNRKIKVEEQTDSVDSGFDFGSTFKPQTPVPEPTQTIIEYLDFDNDSHLTIKTKKSSKFSIPLSKVSPKIDNSNSKQFSGKKPANVKNTQFSNTRAKVERVPITRKMVTPTAGSGKPRKMFKFDLGLIDKNSGRRERAVYPHSCKNANMAAILEIEESGIKSPFNVLLHNEGSLDHEKAQNSTSKILSRFNSNAKISKMSEKSEHNSANLNAWIHKAQTYELRIDRLQLDQKFKIQNYKRMLEDKDALIAQLRAELDKALTKCSELEECASMHKISIPTSHTAVDCLDDQQNETGFCESVESAEKTENNEKFSPLALTHSNSPFKRRKKLSIDLGEDNERSTVQISHFNTTKNSTAQNKFQTPFVNKSKKSFKLYITSTGETNEGLQYIKDAVASLNQEKSDFGNKNRSHKNPRTKKWKHNSKMVSPVLGGATPGSLPQFSDKFIRKVSLNDNKTIDSQKLKGKRLKISETPKVSKTGINSFFGPSKDFGAQQKRDSGSKVATSHQKAKKHLALMQNSIQDDAPALHGRQSREKLAGGKCDLNAFGEPDQYLNFRKKVGDKANTGLGNNGDSAHFDATVKF